MPEISSQRVEKLAQAIAVMAGVIDELRGKNPEIPAEIRSRVERYVKAVICLQCGKHKPGVRYTRGLCANDYNETIKGFNDGTLKENYLLIKGRIAEAQSGGRKTDRSPLTKITELPPLPDEKPVLYTEPNSPGYVKQLEGEQPTTKKRRKKPSQ